MMKTYPTRATILAVLAAAVVGRAVADEAKQSYYREPPLFHYYPSESSPRETIGRFGPVGLSLDLRRNEALAMTVEEIAGSRYLFVEAGGFKEDQAGDWKVSYYVLKGAQH